MKIDTELFFILLNIYIQKIDPEMKSLGLSSKPNKKLCPLTFMAKINQIDIAWFMNLSKDKKTSQDLTKMEAFGNIESITIERFYQDFIKNNGDETYRFVNIGKQTVDLKQMIVRQTNDLNCTGEKFMVLRGRSHRRPRNSANSKYSGAIFAQDSKYQKRKQGILSEYTDFIGSKWFQQNKKSVLGLTPNLILRGIQKEAEIQIRQNCDDVESQDLIDVAINNIQKTWQRIFESLPTNLRDQQITREMYSNPDHPIVYLILYSYTIEGFLYSTLNQAQKDGDLSKVDSLGPYSFSLNWIMEICPSKRTNINTARFSKDGVILYRGTGLDKREIQEQEKIGFKLNEYFFKVTGQDVKKLQKFNEENGQKFPCDDIIWNYPSKMMRFFGQVSTTEDRDSADQFAWENQDEGKVKVVYKIHFKSDSNYYVMDMGSYNHEEEILLRDGLDFIVESVENDTDRMGNPIVLITLQHFHRDLNAIGTALTVLCRSFLQPIDNMMIQYKQGGVKGVKQQLYTYIIYIGIPSLIMYLPLMIIYRACNWVLVLFYPSI